MSLTCNTDSAMCYRANIWITECKFFFIPSSFVAASKRRFQMKSVSLCVTLHVCVLLLMHTRWARVWKIPSRTAIWISPLSFSAQWKQSGFAVFPRCSGCTEEGWRAVSCNRALLFCFSYLEMNVGTEQSGMHEDRGPENEALNSPRACDV